MKIFSGSSNRPLAEKIASKLGLPLSPIEMHVFPDGEKRIRIEGSVAEEHCVIVQSTASPVDENYMELVFIIDALKRSGASQVTVVVPYLGYQRQDHVFREGEAVSLAVVIKMLEAMGADKVIAFDLHSIKIPEFFHIPLVHLSALELFAGAIKKILGVEHLPRAPRDAQQPFEEEQNHSPSLSESRQQTLDRNEDYSESTFSSLGVGQVSNSSNDTILISPDMGGIRRIKILSELLGTMPYAAIVKNRDLATGVVTADTIEGLEGNLPKRVIIVDDMISSGGTIVTAANLLSQKGAEDIYVFATHPVFSEDACHVLETSQVKRIFVTDTIDVPDEKRFAQLEIISVADTIANTLTQ